MIAWGRGDARASGIVLGVHGGDTAAPARKISSYFYQVIITNILFRPLGWTRPKPTPAFELIATVMKSNGKNKALLRQTRDRKLYYVAVGEELETGVVVEKVERRSVALRKNGESKVYRLKWE